MIFLECNPDYALVRALTRIPRREIIHEFKGKFEVCKRLERSNHSKGLVDEDPTGTQPVYVKSLRLENNLSRHDIRVLHDSSNSNYVIILCPKLEDWILRAAKESSIDIRKFGLPNNSNRLHTEINASLNKFEKLLEDLKNSDRLKTLKTLLERG